LVAKEKAKTRRGKGGLKVTIPKTLAKWVGKAPPSHPKPLREPQIFKDEETTAGVRRGLHSVPGAGTEEGFAIGENTAGEIF